MKNISIYSFILIVLLSCYSPKKIINNYLKQELKQNSKTRNIILSGKRPVYRALKIFRLSKVKYKDSMHIVSGSKLYGEKHYNGFKEKYKNDTLKEYWDCHDFKNLKIKILTEDSISSYKKSFKGKSFNFNLNYFSISKPIINESKNIAFFAILKYNNRKGIEYDKIVVYKKENKKWFKVEEVVNTDLH